MAQVSDLLRVAEVIAAVVCTERARATSDLLDLLLQHPCARAF